MVELDYESSHKKYDLIVRAASPPLRTDAHVEILVTDVNDNAPLLRDFQVTAAEVYSIGIGSWCRSVSTVTRLWAG